MNRTVKFMYNIFTTSLLHIVTMLVGFILPKVMLTYYGSEINGLVSSITQFISYFNLVEAGLSGAATYSLYKPLADKDYNGVNAIVSAARKFYNQAGYIFVSLIFAMALIYPMFIKTQMLSPVGVGLLVLVLGVTGALEFFTLAKYRALMAADQKTYVISIASICANILNVTIIIVMAKLGANIVLLRAVALSSVFLRTAILYLYSRKKYKFLDYSVKPNNKALDKRWDALFLQVLGVVQGATPVVLTTIMTTLKTVSVYSIFNMVLSGLNAILSVFTNGLHAAFGDVLARGEIKIFQKAYREFECVYYNCIAVVYSVAMVAIMPFIQIYTKNVSDVNYNVPLYGFLFVINGLLYNIKTPQGMLVGSAGLYKETKWQTTTQAIIGVVAGIVLGIKFKLAGIVTGLILSNLYRDVDLVLFMSKHVTKLNPFLSFGRMIKTISIVLSSFFAASFINVDVNNYFQWFVFAVISMLIIGSFTVVLGLIFEFKDLTNLFLRIRYIVFKR